MSWSGKSASVTPVILLGAGNTCLCVFEETPVILWSRLTNFMPPILPRDPVFWSGKSACVTPVILPGAGYTWCVCVWGDTCYPVGQVDTFTASPYAPWSSVLEREVCQCYSRYPIRSGTHMSSAEVRWDLLPVGAGWHKFIAFCALHLPLSVAFPVIYVSCFPAYAHVHWLIDMCYVTGDKWPVIPWQSLTVLPGREPRR